MKTKIDEKITIYYFSATGNSLKAAKDITSVYSESRLIQIDGRKNIEHSKDPIVGFVFPVHMGTLPELVRSFFLNFQFQKKIFYFAISTHYGYTGSALSAVTKIMKDKGVNLNYNNSILSVGNCLMEYQVSDKKRGLILKRAEKKTDVIISDIANFKNSRALKYYKFTEKIHKALFKLIFGKAYKKFTLEDSCISCGTCANICPVSNIVFEDKKPKWDKECIACHACVHWCPKNAINIGRSKGRLQYHNPNVNLKDILRSEKGLV